MRHFIRALAILPLLLAPRSVCRATTLLVPDDHPTIQDALLAAAPGDSVLVRPGTYSETIDFLGKSVIVAGIAGPEATTIDGGGRGSVVMFHGGEEAGSILAGFTITGGDAGGGYGGGIACTASSPWLRDLVVAGNTALGGAGIHCSDGASPRIEGTIIRDNTTGLTGTGGGLRCAGNGASPVLRDVVIRDNTAMHGGGVYAYDAHPDLRDVLIAGNVATATIPSSPSGGGANFSGGSSPRLERVTIVSNTAGSFTNLSGRGGGLYASGGSRPVLIDVTISGNTATFAGGALYCLADAVPILVNSILWADAPEEVVFDGAFAPSAITAAFSDVEGGEQAIVLNGNGDVAWLEGNIDEDPRFRDPGPGLDYRLRPVSPCIDAGTDFFAAGPDTLVDRAPGEYAGAAPDMGASEHEPFILRDPLRRAPLGHRP